jgi:hypothetical protein
MHPKVDLFIFYFFPSSSSFVRCVCVCVCVCVCIPSAEGILVCARDVSSLGLGFRV